MRFLFLAFIFASLAILSHSYSESTTPSQVHIALAGKDPKGFHNGMAISWQTTENTASSTVVYGTTSGKLDKTAVGSSSAYYQTFHHHVVLADLSPKTEYFYSVGDIQGGFSKEYSFTSAPNTPVANFSFAVFGDLGVTNGESSTAFLNKMVAGGGSNTRLVWHGGDISYADDSFLHKGCMFKFCYEEVWDQYMNNIEPFASAVPYMTAVGNHEADCHDPACLTDEERREKLSNFTAYNTRFRMPSPECSAKALNMHYSFNYGLAHFISIDTETGYPNAAEETRYVLPCGGFADQLSWLEEDLKQANAEREVRPWIFVQGHHPLYQGQNIDEDFQKALEEIFYKYGVDVYFSGHQHFYERDYPVYQGVTEKTYENPRATTYILIGGAGNDEMRDAQTGRLDRTSDPSPREKKAMLTGDGEWTVVTDKEHFGVGRVTVVDESRLDFEYFRTSTGELFDSVTLTRDHSIFIQKK